MRIISGTLGARTFQAPKTFNTHPMSDKIKGALFNMLGDVSGLTFLDAFAGSGSLGFEAISRGASHATLVELDKDAYTTISKNITALNLEAQTSLFRANIKGWSSRNQSKKFDVVICDPPYDLVLENLIHKLSEHVNNTGLLVVSWPTKEPQPVLSNMKLERHKTYGNATLYVYSR